MRNLDMAEFEAFEGFMRDHQNMVFSVAMRLLAQEAEAADITQEVFLKAYDRFDEMADNPKAGAWLRTVTTHMCLNHLTRYRARWRFFSDMVRDEDGRSFEELLPAEDTSHEETDKEHRRHYLEKALSRLPSAQRVPLVLYHFEELSYEEIAAKLGVSLSKVKTDIHRGRETLRRWLQPDMSQWEKRSSLKETQDEEDREHRRSLLPWGGWTETLYPGPSGAF